MRLVKGLVLSVTHQCPIKCKYCGVRAGPDRKERMSFNLMKELIDEVAALRICKLVVFTGGEPLLLGDDLYSAINHAKEKGFVTRVVTNAYWANTPEEATSVVSKLKESGLSEINFSCDDFHQEFIPLENIKWANEAATKANMPALIASKGIKNSRINVKFLEEYLGTRLAIFNPRKGDNPKNNVISYGLTVPVGWESEKLSKDDLLYPDSDYAWKRPCASILENLVISPEGHFQACCGCGSEGVQELVLDNSEKMSLVSLIEDGNNDLIWNWLAIEGPYGIMQFLTRIDKSLRFENRYVNTCHLCHEIFTRPECRRILTENIEEAHVYVTFIRAWLENNRDSLS